MLGGPEAIYPDYPAAILFVVLRRLSARDTSPLTLPSILPASVGTITDCKDGTVFKKILLAYDGSDATDAALSPTLRDRLFMAQNIDTSALSIGGGEKRRQRRNAL